MALPGRPEQDPVYPQPVSPIRKLVQASYSHPSEGKQNENHNHRKLTKLITWVTALSNLMKIWAIPCGATQMGHGRVFWQNIDHWRREWQTTSAFLRWEPHEQYEKADRYDTGRRTWWVSRCPLCYWRKVEKWLQKEWKDWAKEEITLSCECVLGWK